jgi:hypothetical protein
MQHFAFVTIRDWEFRIRNSISGGNFPHHLIYVSASCTGTQACLALMQCLLSYASYYLQRVQARLGGQVAATPVEFQLDDSLLGTDALNSFYDLCVMEKCMIVRT